MIIGGIDEAGRGPLAGPVVAACVIFQGAPPQGIRDSKKLSQEKREELFEILVAKHLIGIGYADALFVDTYGIKKATWHAMTEAVLQLPQLPDHLLVDGNDKFSFPVTHTSIIKGDDKELIIGAASIIAKVTRDRQMYELHNIYPLYGFDKHKGYGTKGHYDALDTHGPSPIHRKSFLKTYFEKNIA